MKVVCISDTHASHDKIQVPDGDLLLFAGDMTFAGELEVIRSFNDWLGDLPHRYKVVIAGNHDLSFEKTPEVAEGLITNAIYLNDSGVEIEGLKIWGSPIQPWFYNWAFNRQRGADIAKHWAMIPHDTDVLITHGPPFGVGDQSMPHRNTDHTGCEDLRNRVEELDIKLHVFGHIHGGAGIYNDGPTVAVNAAVLDEAYRPNGKQFVVDL